MPDVLDDLATLAGHPPRVAPDPAVIRMRALARQRRRHRHRLGAGALAVVVAVVAGGAVILPGEDRPKVSIDDGLTTTSPVDPADALSRTPAQELVLDQPFGMSISPSIDLPEVGEVAVRLEDPPAHSVFLQQCLAEIVEALPAERATASQSLCGSLAYVSSTGAPVNDGATLPVTRRLNTGEAVVDCGVAPGRCVVAARLGSESSTADDRFAPLDFASDGPLPTPSLTLSAGDDLAEGGVADGTTVEVTGRSLPPGDRVTARQCLVEDSGGPGTSDTAVAVPRCDVEARARTATVGDDGSFVLDLTVYREIGVGDHTDGRLVTWTPCDPCVVQAVSSGAGTIATTIVVAPTAAPTRPSLRIVPDGRHSAGEPVRIEGTGFAPSESAASGVHIAVCVGGGKVGHCVYPLIGPDLDERPVVGPDGTFVVEGFVLPGAVQLFGVDCTASPGACELVWHDQYEGAAFGQAIPLDLTG